MRIFGFNITRVSKDEEERKHLIVFKECVSALGEVTDNFLKLINDGKVILSPDSFETTCDWMETLFGLMELYINDPFAIPTSMFNMENEKDRLVVIRSQLASCVSQKVKWDEAYRAHLMQCEMNPDLRDDPIRKAHFDSTKEYVINQAASTIKLLNTTLTKISMIIRYDIIRVACDVDILEEYHKMKKMKIPRNSYTVRFKRLTAEEINKQKEKVE